MHAQGGVRCLSAAGPCGPLTVAKDPTQLLLHKGARVGIVNMMDAEVTHFHTSKVLSESFFKTHLVNWNVDSMLADAVSQRLTQLELVAVPLGASDALMHDRDQNFVNNSVAKGLPKEVARQFAQLAAAERLEALIVLAPALNNSSQAAGGPYRKDLPDYLRGWGYVTRRSEPAKPVLFNMTQVLLIGITPDGAKLQAREWGGGYTDQWVDYVAPPDPKRPPGRCAGQAATALWPHSAEAGRPRDGLDHGHALAEPLAERRGGCSSGDAAGVSSCTQRVRNRPIRPVPRAVGPRFRGSRHWHALCFISIGGAPHTGHDDSGLVPKRGHVRSDD